MVDAPGDDVLIVRPIGRLDRSVVAQLRDEVRHVDVPVVVVLDECIVVEPGALLELDPTSGGSPSELCLVSGRFTCRLLLGRAGVSARFAVFEHLDDAVRARRSALAGAGAGWEAHRRLHRGAGTGQRKRMTGHPRLRATDWSRRSGLTATGSRLASSTGRSELESA